MYERLTALQEGLIPKKKAATDDDLHRINELIQVSACSSVSQLSVCLTLSCKFILILTTLQLIPSK